METWWDDRKMSKGVQTGGTGHRSWAREVVEGFEGEDECFEVEEVVMERPRVEPIESVGPFKNLGAPRCFSFPCENVQTSLNFDFVSGYKKVVSEGSGNLIR